MDAAKLFPGEAEGDRPRPTDSVAASYAVLRAHDDPAIFIALKPEAEAMAEARRLEAEGPQGRSLWGVPVAVKDNIDVAGLPTTAACPAFSTVPARHAGAVARLVAAGAIIIGKTNLDQFATGLVGTRSPFGVPRNTLNPTLVPGGSSSGSATAVAAGIVPIALGTDTAGSGRVPAGLQNIVGLKPSRGMVSTAGVVPACRTLDCVSLFAGTVDAAWRALAAIAGADADDPFSRSLPLGRLGGLAPGARIAVPDEADLDFGGDSEARAAFDAAVQRLAGLGISVARVGIEPLLEAARLLYGGPWVAERWLVIRDLLERNPDAIDPVVRTVIAGRPLGTAADAFVARYRLAALAQRVRGILAGVDALMVPTVPRAVTLAEIAADPIGPNTMLGRYTNFVNLLDLCALAVPSTLARDGTAHGVTFIAPAGRDAALASIGRVYHAAAGLPVGAGKGRMRRPADLPAAPLGDSIELAVVGAHMSGMALNGELTALGATFMRKAETAPHYRLYALPGTEPPRPGLLRHAQGQGSAIALEIWAMPPEGFGRFVVAIPSPLGIGTIALADGSAVKGFLVEAESVKGAEDISRHGGWRAFMAARASLTRP